MTGMKSMLERMIGEPVAIFCARYIYRGILKEVGDDAVLLTNPCAVEVTGRASRETPEAEDPIPSDLIISLGAVEIACQPTWAFAGYGAEKKAKAPAKGK